MWVNDGDPAGYGRYVQQRAFAVIKEYIDADMMLPTKLTGADPEYYASIKATLQKLEDDAFTKIIMGAPIEEFDAFVENWYRLGGQRATDEINEIYNK